MILSMHALAGAALASSTNNVVWGAVLGLVSHYFFDTISHTDYDIGKVEDGVIKMSDTAPFKIAVDLIIGGLIIWYALNTGRLHNEISTIVGAFFGILPDGLTFLYYHIINKERNFFTKLLTKHHTIHEKIHLEAELPAVQYFCQAVVVLTLLYFIFIT